MTRRTKAWLGYSAAWLPLLVFYVYLMMNPQPILARPMPTLSIALWAGLDYVLPVALMGILVWWFVGKLTWPPANLATFVIIHALAALVFSAAWLAAQLAAIAMGTGFA